ncbi:MAG: trypsin-like peptidase domain-containing protein [Candidatus Rariloculaceae bacterium]
MKHIYIYATGLAAALFSLSASAQERSWNETLTKISSGVVSIQVDSTRAFDTERNQSTQATGFVVDAERGLILTNRHVVTPGPVIAQAIFPNQEEVELVPVYRDPVHDFGFFSYNPEHLTFIEPAELPLVPEGAQIGRDIRVVGNDAGEQLSILAGTIARLDRQAPNYGRGNYNDFNTFYMQAASGTSGGSSGSPVLDIDGRVVALNAGASNQAASSFFLPLDRVHRALELIQQDEVVSRGTLQSEFVHKPFAELRRLGLTEQTEAQVREAFPEQTGMLVVERVIPGADAGGFLRPGDILVRANGELVSGFVPVEALLDANVGQSVDLQIERLGVAMEQSLLVDDLDAITPDEFIEYGEGVFNNLSYQQARHYNRPVSGVYVANPGYVFGSAAIPRASLVLSVDGEEMRNLDDLQRVMERLPDGRRATVRFAQFDDPQTERQRVIINDRDWFPAERCLRNDKTGLWPCQELALTPASAAAEPQNTTFPPAPGERYLQRIAPSLVLVNFDMPYTVSGVSDRHYYGTGLIADAERGLVVVDRNTVPVAMGDVRITFAGSLEITGQVEYVHPLHNLSVVSYDPALIGDTPTRSATFATDDILPGDEFAVVGLKPDHTLSSQSSEVASVEAANFPLSRTLRFRESNMEGVTLVNGPDDFDGVIVDRQGRVAAQWATFAFQAGREVSQINMGIPAELVSDMIDRLRDDVPLHSLEVEWRYMPLASARKFGLPESWVETYESHNPRRRQVLSVSSAVAGSPAAEFFRAGDILLSIDGEPLNRFREVELAAQRPEVAITVFRDGREVSETIGTVALSGEGIQRVILWAGALLQAPHREISAQRGIDSQGVYVSYFGFGSPASRSRLFAGRRIVGVDGQPTSDLDSFLGAVSGLSDRESVSLNTVTWNGVPQVITLKLDTHYWPSYELRREGAVWRRERL